MMIEHAAIRCRHPGTRATRNVMLLALSACASLPRGTAQPTVLRSELASAFAQCEADRVIKASPDEYHVIGCNRVAIYSCNAISDPEESICTRIAAGDPVEVFPEDHSAAMATKRANKLFEDGRELYKLGRHLEACDLLSESDSLHRTRASATNLGNCEELDGHFDRAWELYSSVSSLPAGTTDEPAVRFARERAAAIAGRLCFVNITISDPARTGLAVYIGDRKLVPAETIRIAAMPPALTVTAAFPDAPPFRQTSRCAAGATVSISIPSPPRRVASPLRHAASSPARSTASTAEPGPP